MKKQLKYLIIFGAVLVVLGGALAALLLTPNDGDETSSGLSTIKIVDREKDTVEQVELINTHGTLHMVRTGNDKWEIPAMKGLPMSDDAMAILAGDVSFVAAYQKLESPKDAGEYGLAPAQATAKATFSDQSELVFELGNEIAGDSGYYFRVQGEEAIYVVPSDIGDSYLSKPGDFISSVMIAINILSDVEQNQSVGTIDLPWMTLAGETRSSPIEIKKRENIQKLHVGAAAFFIVEKGNWAWIEELRMVELLEPFKTIMAIDVPVVRPTDAQLQEYGLKTPFSTCAFTSGGQTYFIKLGHLEEGLYYAMVDGVDVIYKIGQESVPWAKTIKADLVSKKICMPSITTMKSVTVTTRDGTYKFDVTFSSKEQQASMVDRVRWNNEEIDESNFRSYYLNLIFPMGEEPAQTVPTGKPALTIIYDYQDGDRDVVDYIPNGARRYFAQVNGVGYFNVRDYYVDKIIADTQKVIKNEKVDTDF